MTLAFSGCSLTIQKEIPCDVIDLTLSRGECKPIDALIDGACSKDPDSKLYWSNSELPKNSYPLTERNFEIESPTDFFVRFGPSKDSNGQYTTHFCARSGAESAQVPFEATTTWESSTAGVTDKSTEIRSGNNTVNVTISGTDVLPVADLEVTQTATPSPALVGGLLTYHLTVTNHGPAVTRAYLTDSLPGKPSDPDVPVVVTNILPGEDDTVCRQTVKKVNCAFAEMDAGSSSTLDITVSTTEAGTLHNEVSVEAFDQSFVGFDDPLDNNHSALDTVVSNTSALIASDDSYEVFEDMALPGPGDGGVLENDDSRAVTLELRTPPSHADSFNIDTTTGAFDYRPQPNYFGLDSFIYVAKDNAGNDSNEATVRINVKSVNDPPTLAQPIDSTVPSTGRQYDLTLTDISSGAPNETQELTVTAVSSDQALIPNPTVTYTSPDTSGVLTFSPALNSSGTAIITVTVKDDGGTQNDGSDDEEISRSFTVNVVPFDKSTVNVTAIESNAYESPLVPGRLRFERDGVPGSDLVVSFSITGTAVNGSDYQTLATTVTIPANASSVELLVMPIADGMPESIETVGVTLAASANNNYDVGPQQTGIVAIADSVPSLPDRSTASVGPNPLQVLIIDLNGDGQGDIVTRSSGDQPALSILLNRGDGTFPSSASILPVPFSGDMAKGDFNGDGLEDIVGRSPFNLYVLLSKGDGTFLTAIATPKSASPIHLIPGDVNGDHKLDVVLGSPVQAMLGDGSGKFTAAPPVLLTVDGTQRRFALGDLDDDGILDIARMREVSDPMGNFVEIGMDMFRGDGAGNYDLAGRILGDIGDYPLILKLPPEQPLVPRKADLLWSDSLRSQIQVLPRNGSFTFAATQTYPTAGGRPVQFAAGDVDGDGDTDLVTADFSSKTLSLFVNTGSREFGDAQSIDIYGAIDVGDLNGDNRAEVVSVKPGAVPATDPGILTIVSHLP